jgi:Methylase of polypeptide chain release factors
MRSRSAASGSSFSGAIFSAPEERCRRFTQWVLGYVDAARPLRVLEIGCGTGSQLVSLAAALPKANFIGVDLSPQNVEVANLRAEQLGLAPRLHFVACDYLRLPSAVHDLIVSYSTLHLIACESRVLFNKISGELVAGGLLMNVMPYECDFNAVLMKVRRALALVRSPWTDLLVFRVAKLMHGHNMDDELIRERVLYMYQQPQRLDGPALRRQMNDDCALEFVASVPERHASVAQPKHRLIISRKRGSVR